MVYDYREIERIQTKFNKSLRSIGINPENKDLLEIIAELADEIQRVQIDLYNFQKELHHDR